jgi:hypothetical protein
MDSIMIMQKILNALQACFNSWEKMPGFGCALKTISSSNVVSVLPAPENST